MRREKDGKENEYTNAVLIHNLIGIVHDLGVVVFIMLTGIIFLVVLRDVLTQNQDKKNPTECPPTWL